VPPVTFVTSEAYEGTSDVLVAYQGIEIDTLGRKTPPSKAVIVVGLNERFPLEEENENGEKPSKPTLSGIKTESSIRLIWSIADPDNVNYYYLYKNGVPLALISASSEKIYEDTDLEALAYYTYFIVAYNSFGQVSSESVTVQAPAKPNPVKKFEAILQSKNEVELRWDNDHSQYIASTKLYKRFLGRDNDYKLYKEYSDDKHNDFDRDMNGGDRIFYKITHNSNMGESNGMYDFVYVPYRNILETSPVVLDKISYSWHDSGLNDDIEGWFQGKPEFQIKVLTVDSKGGTAVVFDKKVYATATGQFSCNNLKLHNWLPSNYRWYDVLTFKVIEADPGFGSLKITVDAKINSKSGTDSLGGNMGLAATYTSPEIKFGSSGDDMGIPEYYTYFDPINYVLEFSNFNFKMYLK